MIQLMLITKSSDVAKVALDSGVNRIFVDLEILGKQQRQGHLDTVVSRHSMEDVKRIRQVVPPGALLVRTNPIHFGIREEVEEALASGADLLMLPMFNTPEELMDYSKIIAGRAKLIPLVETPSAAKRIGEVAKVPGVSEVFVGLNDLHLAMGLKFMFQLLSEGEVEKMAAEVLQNGKPFGFGGIARLGEGDLDAKFVLSEHVRLGSSSVILSRTFQKDLNLLNPMAGEGFRAEIQKLRQEEQLLKRATRVILDENKMILQTAVRGIVQKKSK